MVERKTSANEQFQDDLMEVCSCGLFNAIFYCGNSPNCDGPNKKEQLLYCSECMDFHEHKPIKIGTLNKELGKKWSLLFEKIEKDFAIGSKIYEVLEEFIVFCESENKKLAQDQKYSGPTYVDDFQQFFELHKLVILENKELIENLIKDIKLKQILIQEQQYKKYNAEIEYLQYWATMTDDKVYQRYHNVLLTNNEDAYEKLSKETMKTILKFKSYIINKMASQSADPQNQSTNDNFNSLMKLNNETVMIVDTKTEKTIQQTEDRLNASHDSLDTKVTEIQKQIKNSVEQLQGKITSMDNQIKQKQPVTDKEIKDLQALVNELKSSQSKLDQNINQNKATHQNELKQFMRFSFTLFKLQNNSQDQTCDNSFCKLLNKVTTSNQQIWNILQLKASGHIISSPNNKETYYYDAKTLNRLDKLPISSQHIFSAIELQNYIFITNHQNQVLMVNSSNNSLTFTQGGLQHCLSVCGVDNNHIITGSNTGYLQIFNIQNNTLTQTHPERYYDKSIHIIVKLNAADEMGVSVDGVKIIKVINNNGIKVSSSYLTGQTISSIIEYSNQQLICGSYSNNCYYLIDLQAKTEPNKLVDGYSPVLAMTLFPNFHPKNYPFILTRELEWVCILNIHTKFIYKLVKCSGQFETYVHYKKGSSIIFLKDQGLTFMTFDGQFELARYKIEESLMEYLAFV